MGDVLGYHSAESCDDASPHESFSCVGSILGEQPFDVVLLDLAAFVVGVEVEAEKGCAEGTDGDLGDCELQDVNDQKCDPD